MRNRAFHGTGVFAATSPKPLRTLVFPVGVTTSASTPGAPRSSSASASRCRVAVVGRPSVEASATPTAAVPRTIITAAKAAQVRFTAPTLGKRRALVVARGRDLRLPHWGYG